MTTVRRIATAESPSTLHVQVALQRAVEAGTAAEEEDTETETVRGELRSPRPPIVRPERVDPEPRRLSHLSNVSAHSFDTFWEIAARELKLCRVKVNRYHPNHHHQFFYILKPGCTDARNSISRHHAIKVFNRNKQRYVKVFEEFTLAWGEHKHQIAQKRRASLLSASQRRSNRRASQRQHQIVAHESQPRPRQPQDKEGSPVQDSIKSFVDETRESRRKHLKLLETRESSITNELQVMAKRIEELKAERTKIREQVARLKEFSFTI